MRSILEKLEQLIRKYGSLSGRIASMLKLLDPGEKV
jgi:hypothetical protein